MTGGAEPDPLVRPQGLVIGRNFEGSYEAWRDDVLEMLRLFADREALADAWVRGTVFYPPSLGELHCGLFDDLNVRGYLREGILVSPAFDRAIRELGAALHEVDDELDPEELLSSAEWEHVRGLARRAAGALPSHAPSEG